MKKYTITFEIEIPDELIKDFNINIHKIEEAIDSTLPASTLVRIVDMRNPLFTIAELESINAIPAP